MISKAALQQLKRRYEKRIREMTKQLERIRGDYSKSLFEDIAPNFYYSMQRERLKLYWIKVRLNGLDR